MFIYKVFECEVKTSEGCDEGTGDGEHHHHGEDKQHPRVVLSKPNKGMVKGQVSSKQNILLLLTPELEPDISPYCWSLCRTPGGGELEQVPEQFREPDQLQARPDQGGGDDVIDEESSAVGEEDTVPVEVVVPQEVVKVRVGGGVAEGGEDDDHEEKIPEGFLHDGVILTRHVEVELD